MKKVIVLLVGMLMLAAPALALIDNSKHDIPTTKGGAETDEICVYCHTPHGANASFTGGPLWNRNAGSFTLTGVYSSATLNAVIDTDYTKIDAAACLSCHDGSQAMSAMVNPPNSGTYAWATYVVTGNAKFDANMNNDHPVNFDYNAVDAVDTEIEAIGALDPAIKFKQVGATNIMQCSTCHDVHNTVGVNLMVISNAGSNMCRECHLK